MDEFSFIKTILLRTKKPFGDLVKGIGDDCAVIKKNREEFFLWSSDMLVEGTHFKRSDGYHKIGRKAVAVNISDIAAMGGMPLMITVSLGVPLSLGKKNIFTIYEGILDICSEYGMQISGGDTVKSENIVIDIAIMGVVEKKNIVMRSGARSGDRIFITGPVRNGRKEHLTFRPRLEEARFLAGKFRPGAMTDTSDGIAASVINICNASGVGCVLKEDSVPLAKGLSLEDALYYGESFEILFTMSPEESNKLPATFSRNKKLSITEIGSIVPAEQGMIMGGVKVKGRDIAKKMYKHV